MKTKTLLLLILVVIFPTALLSWGGFQLAREQSTQFETQVKDLLRDQLTELDSRIKRYFAQQEASLQDITSQEFATFDSIREVTDSNGVIDNIFVITAKGNLVYPNPIYPLNQREKEFYAKIKTIYEDGEIQNAVLLTAASNRPVSGNIYTAGSSPGPNPVSSQQAAEQNGLPQSNANGPQTENNSINPNDQNRPRRGRGQPQQFNEEQSDQNDLDALEQNQQRSGRLNSGRLNLQQTLQADLEDIQQSDSVQPVQEATQAYEPCSGWFVWYWGRGVNLIYWQRKATGTTICVALERSRWMSDLITELPDSIPGTQMAAKKSEQANPRTTKIVSASGEAVYLWGSDLSDEQLLAAEIPVSSPLTAWKLQMWVMPQELKSQSIIGINIVLGITAFSIALIAVAWIFFTDYAKEIKEAGRRVSFVNQVSHELRTPLTNIRMYAELLGSDLEDPTGIDGPKAQKRIRIVESECERLSRLIGNVLTFAGSQKKNIEVHLQSGVVDACVAQTLSGFIPHLEKLGMEIETEFGAEDVVKFDSDALGQMIGNLISNVEKYAPEGKFVRIITRQTRTTSEIIVEDDGHGIDSKFAEKIFEPFWRMSNELQHASGTGIGLSISRELARLHGGDLTLERSEQRLGRTGSRFVIRIKTEKAN